MSFELFSALPLPSTF